MTKQEIIVAFAVAKMQQRGFLPGDADLLEIEKVADRILTLWPEIDCVEGKAE